MQPNEILTEEAIHDAVDFLTQSAVLYATAKASRARAEHMLKVIKAVAMKNCGASGVGAQERDALACPQYQAQIDVIFNHTVTEETLRAQINGANMKIEIYRTQSANLRGVRL